MPRGKDAPAITGGQIDPYVAGTLQQNKQMAENRLLTAMKEKGATQRAQIGASAQLGTAGIQRETSLQVQAAQSASDDRRAAVVERGHREDLEFRKSEAGVQREFDLKRDEARLKFEKDLIEGNRENLRESRKMILDSQDVQLRAILESEENSLNAIASYTEKLEKRELANEKFITLSAKTTDEADQIEDVHALLVEGSTRKFSERDKSFFLGGFDDFSSNSAKAVGSGQVMSALNDLDKNFQYEDLFSRNISDVSDKIKKGNLVPEDLRTALGNLDGVTVDIKQRITDATDPDEIKFWEHQDNMLFLMRDGLLGLLQNKDPIPDSPGQTVGSKLRDAFGPIQGFSVGQLIKQKKALQKEAGLEDPTLDDFTISRDPYKPWEYTPGSSVFKKDLVDRRNAIYGAVKGPEEEISNWGAD